MSLDQPDIWPITPGSNEPIDFAFLDDGGAEDLTGRVFTLYIAWGEERLAFSTADAPPLLTFQDQTVEAYRGILTFATPLQLTLDLPAGVPITFEIWQSVAGVETPEHAGLIVLRETVRNG